MIVSGINLGLNLGDDVTYSGTVAAALEGTLLGIPAIAVSAHAVNAATADQWDDRAYDFRAPAAFAAAVAPRLLDPEFPAGVVLNVNAPGLPPDEVTGAVVTRLGRRVYNDELTLLDEREGRRRYTIYGGTASHRREDGTDFAAIEAGALSVTPLHFNLTDMASMEAVEALELAALLQVDTAPRSA
jgi:5'-nucleotidase